MLILEYVEKKMCKGSKGVGYCPFPVLCRDTVVVSRQEGHGSHGRLACAHDREPARACTWACQGRPVVIDLLGFSIATELAHPMSRQGFLVSR